MPGDKKKPKVLIMTEWFVPGFRAGGPIKSVSTLAEQMKDFLDIYVLTTNRDLGEPKPYSNVEANKWVEIYEKGYLVNYIEGYNLSYIYAQIRKIRPDYIYLNSMYAFYFSFFIVILKYLGLIQSQIILAPRGMLHDGALKFKHWKKRVFIQLFDRLGMARRLIFHATDKQEYKDIKKHLPSCKSIFTVPNFLLSNAASITKIDKPTGTVRLLYVSRIAPKKNLLFVLKLFTSIRQRVHLTIIGPVEDETYFKQCETQIRELPTNITIEILGALPFDQISLQLNTHHFFVLPSFGENFGHAIYEALSFGRPVLVSDQTPLRNLASKHLGWDIKLNKTSQWLAAIREMIEMDQFSYDKWSTCTFNFIGKQANAHSLITRYVELFSS